jgi:hypothetical protein
MTFVNPLPYRTNSHNSEATVLSDLIDKFDLIHHGTLAMFSSHKPRSQHRPMLFLAGLAGQSCDQPEKILNYIASQSPQQFSVRPDLVLAFFMSVSSVVDISGLLNNL